MPISSAAADLYSPGLEEEPRRWLAPAEKVRMELMQAIERARFYASRKAVKIALTAAAGLDDQEQVDYSQMNLIRNGPNTDMPAEDDVDAVDPRLQVKFSGRMQTAMIGTPFVSLSHDADVAVGFACLECGAAHSTLPPSRDPSPFDLPSHLQLDGRVFGIGVDVAEIRRFGELYKKSGERFLFKALSPDEKAFVQQQPTDQLAELLARRWAIKEALVKASGKRLLFPDMHLDHANQLQVSESVRKFFEQEKLQPHYWIFKRSQMVYAFVILETRAV